jgi:hypothetical protein
MGGFSVGLGRPRIDAPHNPFKDPQAFLRADRF